MKYQINGLLKFWEEDKFEEGCLPGTGGTFMVDSMFTASTPEEVIKKAAEFVGVGKDGIEKNACEEDGRVDFQSLEDAESSPASPRQIEEWKLGKIKLYCSTYTGTVEKVEPVKL